MRLLLLANYEDQPYLQRLQAILGEHSCKLKIEPTNLASQIRLWAQSADAEALIVTDATNLKTILESMPDYVPSESRTAISLENYAGSLLHFSMGNGRTIPVIVIHPLAQLVTVNYGKFVTKRYLSKILKPSSWPAAYDFKYKIVEPKDANAVIARLALARLLAVDIETPYKKSAPAKGNPLRAINCVGYAAWFPQTNTIECYVFPFLEEWAWAAVSSINDNPVAKVTQNGLYDNAYFMRWHCPMRNWLHDSFHLFHSWYSELPKRLDFITTFAVRDVRYWKDDGANGTESYYRYNARDCWATLCSYLSLLNEIPSWAARNYLQEFPLVFPCLHCELEGQRVDPQKWEETQTALKASIETGLTEIRTMVASSTFNPNSPKQMLELFSVLGLGHLKSADAANMKIAMATTPFNNVILSAIDDWKKETKVVNGYLVDEKLWNWRFHSQFNPGKTDTMRMASNASSLNCGWNGQNTPRGLTVKQCMIAEDGWAYGSVDGEQAEARAVAYLSGDAALLALVNSDHDYHSWNAEKFFGVPYAEIYDEVTKKTLNVVLRDLSKRTNHGANYNMGPDVMLATMGPRMVLKAQIVLGLPSSWSLRKVCQHLLDVYAATYPGVKVDWYGWIIRTITETGKLVSAHGWTRVFFGNPGSNKLDLNAAVAHGPQNLSVGVINRGFYAVWREQIYGELRNRIRIKAQIHDEILFQYKIGDFAAAEKVQEIATIPTQVIDCHGVERTMVIPMALSLGKKAREGAPALRWSDCK